MYVCMYQSTWWKFEQKGNEVKGEKRIEIEEFGQEPYIVEVHCISQTITNPFHMFEIIGSIG